MPHQKFKRLSKTKIDVSSFAFIFVWKSSTNLAKNIFSLCYGSNWLKKKFTNFVFYVPCSVCLLWGTRSLFRTKRKSLWKSACFALQVLNVFKKTFRMWKKKTETIIRCLFLTNINIFLIFSFSLVFFLMSLNFLFCSFSSSQL